MTGSVPDVNDAGRVLATLNDWRAVLFALLFIIVFQMLERVRIAATIRQERLDMANERERMWKVSEKFGDAASTLGEKTNNVVTELQVQRALNARLEGVVTKSEEELNKLAGEVAELLRNKQ